MKRRKREKKRQAAQCRRLSATVVRSLCVSSDSTAIVGACLVAYAMRVLSTKLKYLYCILVDFNARATVTRLQQTYILYGRELRVLTGRLRLSAILKNSFSAWFALVVDCVRALYTA